jgi:hypothetical protein
MFNVAGSRFDFANVLHAVLQECEHRRRAFTGDDAAERLTAIARAKLEAIGETHDAAGGSPTYWRALTEEVLGTAMPQYVPAAVRQSAREETNYDTWRQGDLLARALFALAGLTVGGIVVALPFIPIFEEAFAFFLALCGWIYPELRKLTFDHRHARLMNRLLKEAARYQATQLQYLSDAALEEVLEAPLPGEQRGQHHHHHRGRQRTPA